MKKHPLKEWILATRPWSFPASAMPVIVTWVYLYGLHAGVNWENGIWALVNIVLFHAAGNVWSDYFDYRKGVDTVDTFGATTLTSGKFSPGEIFSLGLGLLGVAVLLGVGLLIRTGLPLLWIGLGGIFCTLLYPFFKYRALGDVIIFMAYALLPSWGTSYVILGFIDMQVYWVAVPIGLITVAILHANNTRDVVTDVQAGIKTFAICTGYSVARRVYAVEILFSFVWIGIGIVMGYFSWWTLLVMVVFPLAWGNVRLMLSSAREEVGNIAHLDEKTAQLQLAFSSVLSLALLVSIWLA
ncbi:prenyltransferase [Odoribacter lunatus]|uniref:prenyltransferase n=1 Tax=Odoribacter lunatus TaxID=2941335 RepID=UPI00203D44AA|nr:prenyltransferase [Odoribacter lunatus]